MNRSEQARSELQELYLKSQKEHEIVERLKKFFNQDNVLTKQEYKQKILGDKK